MCFSTEVSFATSAVLIPAGAYCLRSAWGKDRRYLALAAVPFFFGVQQIFEGLVWAGIGKGNTALTGVGSLGFLFLALWFWPFWTPLSLSFTEERAGARRVLLALALLGLVLGGALYLPLALDYERLLKVEVVRHSVRYDFSAIPAFEALPHEFWQLSYLAIVFLPLAASPNRSVRAFSVLLALSAAVSHVAFRYAAASVWCFFAAVLSSQFCLAFATLPGRGGGPAAGPSGR